MQSILVSFTLRAPEEMEDYKFFYQILEAVSVKWIKRDETEVLIVTPYSPAVLLQLLKVAIDANDTINIYSVSFETGVNQTGTWQAGGLGDPASVKRSRQFIQQLRIAIQRFKRAS